MQLIGIYPHIWSPIEENPVMTCPAVQVLANIFVKRGWKDPPEGPGEDAGMILESISEECGFVMVSGEVG